jgi:hypothetical protein
MARWIARRDSAEQQLDEELRAYVELAAADNVRDGVPAAEARRLAVLELGGIEPTKERVRTYRHGALLHEIGRDVRYAVRMFAAHKGFTLVVMVTLALGIGANTAIFSLMDALTLRWLPVRAPQDLLQITLQTAGEPTAADSFSYALVRAIDEQTDLFAGAAGFSAFPLDIGHQGDSSDGDRHRARTARGLGRIAVGCLPVLPGLTDRCLFRRRRDRVARIGRAGRRIPACVARLSHQSRRGASPRISHPVGRGRLSSA